MARRLTTAENISVRNLFPLLDTSNVWVLGEATGVYNCLAWSLRITSRWVWPWGGRNATDSEMAAFLRSHGLVASSSGTRLTWGFSWSSIGHISRYYNGTWLWTSKLGPWLLINHPRDGLNYGNYGTKRRFYTASSLLGAGAD